MNRTTHLAMAALFALLIGISATNAQSGIPDQTPARIQGISASATDSAQYAPYPTPVFGYVTDLADVLSTQQEDELDQVLWEVEKQSDIEIAVLTINSIDDFEATGATSIESFARGLFDKWNIGNMPANHGVLLLIAVRDRKARIELGAGYGNLRDSDAARIMTNTIVPHFKNNDYSGGIRAGVESLASEFAGVHFGWNWWLIVLLACAPLAFAVGLSLILKGKRGWGWVFVGSGFILGISVLAALQRAAGDPSNWSGGSSGGFGIGGGSGGGFSGGGGATGSW